MIKDVEIYPELRSINDYLRVGEIILGEDAKIIIVEIDSDDLQTVNHWVDYSIDIRENWKDDSKPIYIMVDMSRNDLSFGRLASHRMNEMSKVNPHITTYISWVIRNTLLGKLLSASLSFFNYRSRAAKLNMVHSRKESYAWLQEMYTQE